jgi:hypothetical protein
LNPPDETLGIWNAIVALHQAGGGVLYFPAGEYNLTFRLPFGDIPVTICGDGIGVSVLKWTSQNPAAAGIVVIHTPNNFAPVTVHDLSLHTTHDLSGASSIALEISYDAITHHSKMRCSIEGLEIRGEDTNAHGWQTAIRLQNCQNATVRQVFVSGTGILVPNGQATSLHGILYAATGAGNRSTDFKVSQCLFIGVRSCIAVSGAVEGVSVHHCTGIFPDRFLEWTAADVSPQLMVSECHSTFREYGIYTFGVVQSFISKNLFYAHPSNEPGLPPQFPAPVAVLLGPDQFTSPGDATVSENTIITVGATGVNGVVIGLDYVKVINNTVAGNAPAAVMSAGVWLRLAATKCAVLDNIFRACDQPVINENGPSVNYVRTLPI